MVELKGQSVTMLAIGPVAVFSPEMIPMATWRPCSTPYGAYSIAESAEWPMTAGSVADENSSATPAIGNTNRFSVSLYRSRIRPERGRVRRRRNDSTDGDRWFGPAAE